MSNAKLKSVLVVSLAFNLAVIAAFTGGWARQRSVPESRVAPHGDPEGSRSSGCDRIARGMGLCESKAECLRKEMTRYCCEEDALKESLGRAREELMMLLHSESPDSADVLKKVEQIASLQSDLEKLLVGRLLRSHNCLDREERGKFLGMIGCKCRTGHARDGKS